MSNLTIKQTVSAFTKTAKDAHGNELRKAIGKFNFDVELSFNLESEKMQQVVSTLIIDAVKVAVQNNDRAELWNKDTIAQKFTEEFAKYDEDAIYKLVCTRENNNFGLNQFKSLVQEVLVPAIDAVKPLDDKAKATITHVTNAGRNMPEQSMTKVLAWIDAYCADDEKVETVINYLTARAQVVNDLSALEF